MSGLCSSQIDFNAHISNLKDWSLARDYPQKVVNEQIDKVVFGKQPARKDTSEQRVPFYCNISSERLKLKNLELKNFQLFLYSENEVKSVFSSAPMVSYRSARKIKKYIVRSKLYPIDRKVGSYRYGNSGVRYVQVYK